MNNDLISRDELLKRIDEEREYLKSRGQFGAEHILVHNFRDLVDNAPTVEERPQGEWIPVSERLPERDKEVIVTDIETEDTYCSWYLGEGYWQCDNGMFNNRIIAWQPFPEPYKKGGAEE